MTLRLWVLGCVAVLVASVWRAWPHSAGEAVAWLMSMLTLPVSAATGVLFNAVAPNAWLPRSEPWHSAAIWAVFFVPGLLQWLALRRLWRAWRGR